MSQRKGNPYHTPFPSCRLPARSSTSLGQIQRDLARKPVLLTGPRQVGKTTLARQLMRHQRAAQYLNWDVAVDRA
ncbi:MAG: AAA family ATPase, partial [Cyanobium sp.]